jgi:hypothetical protein
LAADAVAGYEAIGVGVKVSAWTVHANRRRCVEADPDLTFSK